MKTILLAIAIFIWLADFASAQLFDFATFAGTNGFNNPVSVAMDSAGSLFVANADDNDILKILPDGAVSVFAGSPGIAGSANANGTNALFNSPQGVAVDNSGNIFVADSGNNTIRQITPAGTVTTFAGSPTNSGSADGAGANARFFHPRGIVADSSGNLFVADTFNHSIRKITSAGVVTTIAGLPGFSGGAGGAGNKARFNRPTGIALDQNGNLFVADSFNHSIRQLSPNGTNWVVSTIAGLPGVFGGADGTNSDARFFLPSGIAFDGTNFFVADSGNHAIRQLSPNGTNWIVTTIAGWPQNAGNANGSGIAARFFYPAGLTVNTNGQIFVADSGNNLIRSGAVITNNPPVILTQPQNQSVGLGNSVAFSVVASNAATFYYQWQFDGEDIPDATGSSFTLTDAQSADAGNYSVSVSSATGSVASSNAVLTVVAPPGITSQPANQSCLQGATVSFSVSAAPLPLTYQWQKNGHAISDSANVSGATTTTLTISNVSPAAAANYSVLVNNGYDTTASSPATLTVFALPAPDSIQPVAWWRLNEGGGAPAYDYSGNGHDGTLNSGVNWTADGHAGNGVYFSGATGGDITIANPFLISGDWTATMWVNRWGAKDSSVLIGGAHDALKLEQHSHTNYVGYTVYGKADYALGYVTLMNAWTHLAFVKTDAGVSLYVNGVFNSSSANVASLDATTLGFGLAAASHDYLDATLNDVRLYTNALTAAQIANLYTYGRISPATNPPRLAFAVTDSVLQISWPADHIRWRLQIQTNSAAAGLSTNWVDVPDATRTNQIFAPVNPNNGSVFYRLIYP